MAEQQEIARWFRQLPRGGHVGDVPIAPPPPQRHVRWAKTAAEDGETYPTSGNVLPVVLGEYVFDDTQDGQQTPTFTPYEPADVRHALFPTGYQAEGTITRLTLHDNVWFGPSMTPLIIAKTPAEGLSARSGTTIGGGYCTVYSIIDLEITALGTTQFVGNIFSTACTGNAYVICGVELGGNLVVISQDCP